MPFKIVASQCTRSSACEPLYPNVATSEKAGNFVIESQKCTECIVYFDEPQCVAVCPVENTNVMDTSVSRLPRACLKGGVLVNFMPSSVTPKSRVSPCAVRAPQASTCNFLSWPWITQDRSPTSVRRRRPGSPKKVTERNGPKFRLDAEHPLSSAVTDLTHASVLTGLFFAEPAASPCNVEGATGQRRKAAHEPGPSHSTIRQQGSIGRTHAARRKSATRSRGSATADRALLSSGRSGRKHLLEAEALASAPIELYRFHFYRLAGLRCRRWQSSAFYSVCRVGTQRIAPRRLGWVMNDEAIEFRRMVARRMRPLATVNDPDTSVHLEYAQRPSPHLVTALNREAERHARYEVASRIADDESACLIADKDNMLQKSTSARVSVRPAGSRGDGA